MPTDPSPVAPTGTKRHVAETWTDRLGRVRTTCAECEDDWPCPAAGGDEARRLEPVDRPDHDCPYCGPSTGRAGICDQCDMTPGEHRYRARILADSEAVLREEREQWRAAQSHRKAG